jgi:hypothetical protein
MRGTILYGPGDVRFEKRADRWPYRGVDAPDRPTRMGHEYRSISE